MILSGSKNPIKPQEQKILRKKQVFLLFVLRFCTKSLKPFEIHAEID